MRSRSVWKEALERLERVELVWHDQAARQAGIASCRQWFATQERHPRLVKLARLLEPDICRSQFWCVLVPVEREVARRKITDMEILDADLPRETPLAPHMPLTVVVDSVRSAFNMGGIFRNAECFRVSEVVLCGYTPLPDQPRLRKSALGTEQLVAWRHAEQARQVILELQAAGVVCLALETVKGAEDVDDFVWPFPCALVLGNERFGIDPALIALCDHKVCITLHGRKNSLNVATALALAARAARVQFDRGR